MSWQSRGDIAILFLDFDGVLHPVGCRASNHFRSSHLLSETLRTYANVRIVVSSSWRRYHRISALRRLLGPLGWRVIGKTAAVPLVSTLPQREAACRLWLHAYAPACAWIALDDQPALFSLGCRNLYATNAHLGLCVDDCSLLRKELAKLTDRAPSPI